MAKLERFIFSSHSKENGYGRAKSRSFCWNRSLLALRNWESLTTVCFLGYFDLCFGYGIVFMLVRVEARKVHGVGISNRYLSRGRPISTAFCADISENFFAALCFWKSGHISWKIYFCTKLNALKSISLPSAYFLLFFPLLGRNGLWAPLSNFLLPALFTACTTHTSLASKGAVL